MKTTRLPANACLSCGAPNDAVTDPTSNLRPSPGDVSICLYCGHVTVFDDDLKLRNPNDEEIIELAGHPEMLRFQKARGKLKL